ncbi:MULTISPECIES: hypothetical protein [unclassified Synechococcus]
MPMELWQLFALGSCLGFFVVGWLATIGQLCLGIGITLTLLARSPNSRS